MVVIESGFPTIASSALMATEAQVSVSSGATVLSLGIVLAALAIAVRAVGAGVSTLLSLIRELVALLVAQVGRLLLLCLCLLCLVVVLTAQPEGACDPPASAALGQTC